MEENRGFCTCPSLLMYKLILVKAYFQIERLGLIFSLIVSVTFPFSDLLYMFIILFLYKIHEYFFLVNSRKSPCLTYGKYFLTSSLHLVNVISLIKEIDFLLDSYET